MPGKMKKSPARRSPPFRMNLRSRVYRTQEDDWQMNKTQRESAKCLLEREEFCDVEFKVGDKGDLIKGHKLILAQRTPVFEKMFYGSLPESTTPIVIPDVEPAAFKALLRYCYYDCLDVPPNDALATHYAAKKYMLPLLEEACSKIQIQSFQEENIWQVYTSSIRQPDATLLQACRRYFSQSLKNVVSGLSSESFLDIPREVLLDLMQLNCVEVDGKSCRDQKFGIVIADIELFKACNAWACAECLRLEIEANGVNKRMILGDCLPMIRFPIISISDIYNIVSPTNILTQDEFLSLIGHALADPAVIAPLRFLSTKHYFMVSLHNSRNYPGTTDSIKEYSSLLKRNSYISSMEIRPRERLLLSGILVYNFVHPERPAEHEVSIIENTKQSPLTKLIMSSAIDDDDSPCHILEFEEVHLKANTNYVIKVDLVDSTSDTNPFDFFQMEDFYDRTLDYPEDLNIDVVNMDNNEHIIGLRMRLF